MHSLLGMLLFSLATKTSEIKVHSNQQTSNIVNPQPTNSLNPYPTPTPQCKLKNPT